MNIVIVLHHQPNQHGPAASPSMDPVVVDPDYHDPVGMQYFLECIDVSPRG